MNHTKDLSHLKARGLRFKPEHLYVMGGGLSLGGIGKFSGILWELPSAKGNSGEKGAMCVVSNPPSQQLGDGSIGNGT